MDRCLCVFRGWGIIEDLLASSWTSRSGFWGWRVQDCKSREPTASSAAYRNAYDANCLASDTDSLLHCDSQAAEMRRHWARFFFATAGQQSLAHNSARCIPGCCLHYQITYRNGRGMLNALLASQKVSLHTSFKAAVDVSAHRYQHDPF